jgi:hypothetical protein
VCGESPEFKEDTIMCTYVAYDLRIEGRLPGAPEDNKKAFEAFKRCIGNPSQGEGGTRWPEAFVQKGFKVDQWLATFFEAAGNENETVLSFFAQASMVLPRKLYENRETLQPVSNWLHTYRDEPWYKDLHARLEGLNKELQTLDNPPPIENVRIRGWEWMLRDGGNS